MQNVKAPWTQELHNWIGYYYFVYYPEFPSLEVYASEVYFCPIDIHSGLVLVQNLGMHVVHALLQNMQVNEYKWRHDMQAQPIAISQEDFFCTDIQFMIR